MGKLRKLICTTSNFINNFFSPSFKSLGIIVCVATIIYILLPLYQSLIDATIVKWTTNYFNNNTISSILYIVSISIVTLIFCRWLIKQKNQWVHWKYINILIGIIGLWIYYRFIRKIWYFEPIFQSDISYIDIMIIADLSLVICGLYVNIKTYWKLYIDRKSHTESLRLKQDIPISNIKDDRFNRKIFIL